MGDGLVHDPHDVAEDELGNDAGLDRRLFVDVRDGGRADVLRSLHIIFHFLVGHLYEAEVGHPGGVGLRRLDLHPVAVPVQDLDHGAHQGLVAQFGGEVGSLAHQVGGELHDGLRGFQFDDLVVKLDFPSGIQLGCGIEGKCRQESQREDGREESVHRLPDYQCEDSDF